MRTKVLLSVHHVYTLPTKFCYGQLEELLIHRSTKFLSPLFTPVNAVLRNLQASPQKFLELPVDQFQPSCFHVLGKLIYFLGGTHACPAEPSRRAFRFIPILRNAPSKVSSFKTRECGAGFSLQSLPQYTFHFVRNSFN